MKYLTAALRAALHTALLTTLLLLFGGTTEARDSFNPSFEWQTDADHAFCPTPFALEEGHRAASVRDVYRFEETGCHILPAGLRVIMIEAVNLIGTVSTWHGRIYPQDGSPSFSAYFKQNGVVTYAIYGHFRNHAEAEREVALLTENYGRVPPSGVGAGGK
jgi:hypothetical protein